MAPRRRFYRPAAEMLGARRQVPVLTGLPEIDGDSEVLHNESADAEGQHAGDGGDAGYDQAIAAEVASWTTADTSAEVQASEDVATRDWRTWLYPIGGTLIAGLLIYAAVVGLLGSTSGTSEPVDAWDVANVETSSEDGSGVALSTDTTTPESDPPFLTVASQESPPTSVLGDASGLSPIDATQNDSETTDVNAAEDQGPPGNVTDGARIATLPSELEQRWPSLAPSSPREPRSVGDGYESTPYPDLPPATGTGSPSLAPDFSGAPSLSPANSGLGRGANPPSASTTNRSLSPTSIDRSVQPVLLDGTIEPFPKNQR